MDEHSPTFQTCQFKRFSITFDKQNLTEWIYPNWYEGGYFISLSFLIRSYQTSTTFWR